MTQNQKLAQLRSILATIATGREIADSEATILQSMIYVGASVKLGAQTNAIRFLGITATCTWSQDKGLIDGWVAAANRWIERIEGDGA